MRKLRVLLLVDEDLVPPDACEGDPDDEEWRTEYSVMTALREMGHEVRPLGVVRNLEDVERAYRDWQPHIAFNLLEDCYWVIPYDHHMVAYLELLGLPYTGCNPTGLLLSRDKALTKKLLAYHRIRVPDFLVCRRGRAVRRPRRLAFPLIVKSLHTDSSNGLSQQSVVHDDAALAERVAFIHDGVGTDAIVEQFIDGRELFVGVLGNRRLTVLPPWELRIGAMPEGEPFVYTRELKWDDALKKRLEVTTGPAEGLPEPLASRLPRLCRRICRRLHLSGYTRLDFRLDAEGRLWLLEANANPQICRGDDFAEPAEAAGLSYPRLLQRILDLGLRWHDDHAIA